VARVPDSWAWPDWANVGSDGTFGHRWDDPEGLYRVLYASSSPLGAFVEVLARFRPDPHILEALKEIEEEAPGPSQAPGELDVAWLERRCIRGNPDGTSSISRLGSCLAERAASCRRIR